MKRHFQIAICAFAIMTLMCGCGTVNITCSLDEGNYASIQIEVYIPKENLTRDEISSVEVGFGEILTYWQNEGYETKWEYDDTGYTATLINTVHAKTTEEAHNVLIYMMGSDFSPFSYVEGGYSKSYFSDIYNISAEVDLSGITDYNYIKTLPKSQREKIMQALASFSGTVTFDLLGEIINHTGTLKDGNPTVNLSIGEAAAISSVMEVANTENKQAYESLVNDKNRFENEKNQYKLWMIVSGGVLFAALIIVIVLIGKRKKTIKNFPSRKHKKTNT